MSKTVNRDLYVEAIRQRDELLARFCAAADDRDKLRRILGEMKVIVNLAHSARRKEQSGLAAAPGVPGDIAYWECLKLEESIPAEAEDWAP